MRDTDDMQRLDYNDKMGAYICIKQAKCDPDGLRGEGGGGGRYIRTGLLPLYIVLNGQCDRLISSNHVNCSRGGLKQEYMSLGTGVRVI